MASKRKEYVNKKVTVIGLCRSGLAAAVLLKDLGAEVSVTDQADTPQLRENAQKLKSLSITNIELGRHTIDFIKGRDLVVASPGVSDKSQVLVWADALKIPVISEIELAASVCPATIIATTGTNGKTTVTTLIGEVIKASGRQAYTCGNIGNPFSGEISRMKEGDFVSVEVSSFQLERIKNFKPKAALILNFTPDHLDRYKDMSEYLAAKKRIFMNQDASDYLILNYDDSILRGLAGETKAKVVYFKQGPGLNPNQSATLAAASALGISRDLCLEVFRNFKGVKHRLESVREINGIEFINDSKATNVDSTIWALNNISKPIWLIAGGRDKGIDYTVVSKLVKQKVKQAILIGEAKDKIRNAFSGLLPLIDASSLEEAVKIAYQRASSGDCVLFSPMCASFDMFQNYEHRGEVFREIVLKLK